MKKTLLQRQVLDETAINGPMMADKKMTQQEHKKLLEIINKSKAKSTFKKNTVSV